MSIDRGLLGSLLGWNQLDQFGPITKEQTIVIGLLHFFQLLAGLLDHLSVLDRRSQSILSLHSRCLRSLESPHRTVNGHSASDLVDHYRNQSTLVV